MNDKLLILRAFSTLNQVRDAKVPELNLLPSFHELVEDLRARLAQPEPEPEPVAWRTFDGEGGYEYRSYEMNENYGAEWLKRNPNHKGWVKLLYTDPTPCQTCEALARTVMMDQTSHDTNPPQREPEAVGWHHPDCEGECLACLIEREVQNAYGNQGIDYLRRHIAAPLREKNT